MRVLITGSRTWDDPGVINKALDGVVDEFGLYGDAWDVTIVHGGARGADTFAEEWAEENGWDVEVHKPDYAKHGSIAPLIRNVEMVNLGADVVLAFQRGGSRGTAFTIEKAQAAGLDVRVWTAEE